MIKKVRPWEQAPYLRLVPPLILGIIWGNSGLATAFTHTVLLMVSLLSTLAFSIKILRVPYKKRWIAGINIQFCLFFTGALLCWSQNIRHHKNWYGHHLSKAKLIIGSPQTLAVPMQKTYRQNFRVVACIDAAGKQRKIQGTLFLYLPQSASRKFMPGDWLAFSPKKIRKIPAQNNPAAFDFSQFCARQNIYHQAYIREAELFQLPVPSARNLDRLLARGQLSALGAIRKTIPSTTGGLAMALLIGYRYELDKPLLTAYSNTGVVHVIAVSGMHLGLIFFLLQKLLFFPDRKFKIIKWLKAFFVLLVIWWFSGVAGAAASIMRAAFMFSFTLLAKLFRKPADSLQSISLGAFALLCYNPFWLWDAGFQLSFTALLGIIFYQPLISAWLNFTHPLVKNIWLLISVTLAAQVLTLPISIGLFHMAPVYFLVANLFAVPISSIALITAILQWLFTSLGTDLSISGTITDWLLRLMNTIILQINSLPWAVIRQIQWTPLQVILAYAIIISVSLWLTKVYRPAFWAALVCILCFSGEKFRDNYIKSGQQQLLVLQLKGNQLICLRQGKKLTLLSTAPPAESVDLTNLKRFYHIQAESLLSGEFYRIGNHSIAIPQSNTATITLLNSAPQYLFLNEKTRQIESLLPHISAQTTLVIDGSVPEWMSTEWIPVLKARSIKYYSTWESGAMQIPLN